MAGKREHRVQCRRQFLTNSFSIGTACYAASAPLISSAQESSKIIRSALDAIEENKQRATVLFDELASAGVPLEEETMKYIANEEHYLRTNLVSRLSELSLEPAQHRTLAINAGQYELYLLMEEFGVSTLPNVEEIQITNVERISETIETVSPCDRLRATVLIFIDIVGLTDHAELVIELIRETQLQDKLEDLVAGYDGRDWEDLPKGIIEFMGLLASADFIARIVRRAGTPLAAVVLKRFSLILMPYVGPVYGALVVFAAVRKNWELITC